MKMLFHPNEMVAININSYGLQPKHVQIQKIANYLTENVKECNFLENTVILGYLPWIKSICLRKKTGIIILYPDKIKLSVSKELYDFLYSLPITE